MTLCAKSTTHDARYLQRHLITRSSHSVRDISSEIPLNNSSSNWYGDMRTRHRYTISTKIFDKYRGFPSYPYMLLEYKYSHASHDVPAKKLMFWFSPRWKRFTDVV